MHSPPRISVIIPARNEEACIADAIRSASRSAGVEIIVVDGCSTDRTADVALASGAHKLLRSRPGRAAQMNAGAAAASADILLFLHADSRLPAGFARHVHHILNSPATIAGAFALDIRPAGPILRILASASNFRSRAMRMPYGDQAIFLTRSAFQRIGGFPDLPIMEDLELVRRLRRLGHIRIANPAVRTSARRWLRTGPLKTTLLNQILILAYYLGVPPQRLYRWRESGTLQPASY